MTHVRQAILLLCAAAWIAIVCASGGCGSTNNERGGPDAGQYDSTGHVRRTRGRRLRRRRRRDPGALSGVAASSATCPPGCTTSLSGTVYDPAGAQPALQRRRLHPERPAAARCRPITPGTHSCNTCDVSIGDYVAATTTDSHGHFTLTGVPGDDARAARRADRQVAPRGVPPARHGVHGHRRSPAPTAACRRTTARATCRRWPSSPAAATTSAAS